MAVEAVEPDPKPSAVGQGHERTQAIHLRRGPFARRGRTTLLDRPPVKRKETKIGSGIPRDVCGDVGLIPAGDDEELRGSSQIQISPSCQGPVMAKVIPGIWRLANSHFPSGLNVAPAHSSLR